MRRIPYISAITILGFACIVIISITYAASIANAADQAGAASQAPAPAVAAVPEKVGAYEYTGLDRRDPFAPLVSKRESGREKGSSPLESYDVSEMKIIAILWEKNKYFAVVSLPDGKSYNVNDGVKVGSHSGVVAKITKDTVVIRERMRDATGVMSPRDTVLRLRGEEEE
ncbi:MAG TPA: pilus assembly protein PilP [Dissulfurispiraceae bacterium]|nr:pilus assembly protein PilP [Dissulfurispiraceae bacterium]